MSNTPNELKYTRTHEWARPEKDQSHIMVIGITDHAQQLLGDIVYVQLPNIGDKVTLGQEVGVIESVKAAADFYSPLSGEITAVNDHLSSAPELINTEPYDKGWLYKLKLTQPAEVTELLSAEDYSLFATEEH